MRQLDQDRALTTRRGSAPLFLTVHNLLKARLDAGEWKVGDRFPTIQVLGAEFGVSRITIRTALEKLERSGYIRRERGSGTTVTRVPTQPQWLLIPNDWESLVRHIEGLETRTEDIAFVPASAPLGAEDMAAADYWQAKRANHLPDGRCYSITHLWLDRRLYDRDPKRFRTSPVLPALLHLFPDRVGAARQRLTITTADIDSATWLDLDAGAPVARIHRIVRDNDGVVLYAADALYPADQMAIETDLLNARPSAEVSQRPLK
ncbi:GntR family transcriptional regulator [Oceanibium sediminis]|uniref:GntR family transcriptional regulator n=1 Tax=Oceanibium sediminis TaxID=2026339 RepID=UPI0018E54A8F|nr:GntR family transcriptional regulator [Oceanibium sediminis]